MQKEKYNQKKRIIGINLFLVALLFGLVSLNKEILRPLFNHVTFLRVLTGSFPNFIAAYIISLAIMNAVMIKKPKYGHLLVYLGSFLVFAILTVEEIKPLWGVSTTYDLFDICANGLGSILSILTFELITFIQKKSANRNKI